MEQTLPENHPDMIRIVQAAHRDIAPKPPKGQANSLANVKQADVVVTNPTHVAVAI